MNSLHYGLCLLLVSSVTSHRINIRRAAVQKPTSQKHYTSNYAGALSCNNAQWMTFVKKFGPGNTSLVVSTSFIGDWLKMKTDFDLAYYSVKPECKNGHVLWLMGSSDDNDAFKYGSAACYSLLEWSKTSCSVVVKKVSTNQEAVDALDEYEYDSIKHLVFAGHGAGDLMVWRNEPLEELKVDDLASRGVLKKTANRLKPGATIFLDSCYGATLHEEECLAHYMSRMMGKGITVTASVHGFSSDETAIQVHQDEFKAVVVHGARVFKQDISEMGNLRARQGDWVRCYYPTSQGGMSTVTSVGLVVGVTPAAYLVRLKASEWGAPSTIPGDWITRRVKVGEQVFLPSDWDHTPPVERFVYEGGDPNFRNGNWFLLKSTVTGQRIRSAGLWPIGQQPPVLGKWYPRTGDWIRIADYSDLSKKEHVTKGIVIAETRDGAKVLFIDKAEEESKELDIDVSTIEDVGKPGQRVEYYKEGKSTDLTSKLMKAFRGDEELSTGTIVAKPLASLAEEPPDVYINDDIEETTFAIPVQFIKRVIPEDE